VQLKDILKEKRREMVTKVVLSLHNNAPAHRALATQKKLAYLAFQFFWSPTLFSVSDPVGLPPVPWTEEELKSRRFSTEAEVIATAETWLEGQISEFFLSGL